MRSIITSSLVAATLFAASLPAVAQQPAAPAGQDALADCREQITKAASVGEAQRRGGADEIMKSEPKLSEMNCLGDMLEGAGLDLFGTGFDFASMLRRAKSQVCSAGQSALAVAKNQGQGCGIYASGWNMGVPGYGMGQLCRSVYLGGGGGEIIGAGTRRANSGFGNVFGRAPDAAAR